VWSAESIFVCALTLLGRSQAQFPAVQFVERAPAYVSPLAQAYIEKGDVRIVLITSTSAFDRARRSRYPCADVDAIREIAGVLAHEEWHVLHGADEASAYDAQLTALLFAGAQQDGPLYHKVMRAKQTVIAASKRTSGAGVMASAAPGSARAHPA
jgi:hypothetical protein